MYVQPGHFRWTVLPQVLEYGRQAEEVFRRAKENGESPKGKLPGKKLRREERLRFRDPW